jgi:hypothetical protein
VSGERPTILFMGRNARNGQPRSTIRLEAISFNQSHCLSKGVGFLSDGRYRGISLAADSREHFSRPEFRGSCERARDTAAARANKGCKVSPLLARSPKSEKRTSHC